MIFTLYKTLDDDNVVGKVLTDPLPITIYLRSDTDVNDPMIPLQRIAGINFNDYNYAHLPELGRYYFIREWQIVNAAIVTLGLNLDHLETYKSQILAATGTFKRPVKVGDYGDIELDLTGRETKSEYGSTITLTPDSGGILSLIKPE